MPNLPVELHPSRLLAATLVVAVLGAIAAALVSNHPWLLKAPLLVVIAALLAKTWRDEIRHGVRQLAIEEEADPARVTVRRADGGIGGGRYAGHAIFGMYAVFVYVDREGWRRLLGPERFTVLRDATDPDSFRRLRATVRLGL